MQRTVTVRTPATSANLGPGFDALGLALTLYDEVTAQVVAGGTAVEIVGEGAGVLPTGEDHLIVKAMRAAFERLGVEQPRGVRLRCVNAIPQARGLGSSSAAIVAGVILAQALAAGGTPSGRNQTAEALKIAAELEGHPDNVAPCILGGFTIAWLETGREHIETARERPDGRPAGAARAISLRPAETIRPVVFVPQTQGLTAQARAALPKVVPHADAAFNAGRSALLVQALTKEPGLLMEATEDRLHQDYRAPAMPETAALVKKLRGHGIPAVVSGAGPTVLAVLAGEMPDMTVDAGWVRHNLCFDLVGTAFVE